MAAVEIREPFPAHSWPLVWGWTEPFRRRVADDFAPKNLDSFVESQLGARRRTWGVYRDGELGGLITFEQSSPVAGVAHVIFKRSFWGSATTQTAMRQAATVIFESGVLKVGAAVFADNHAMKSAAIRLGFKVEGLLRSQTLRDGQPVDMALFGLVREDFLNGTDDGSRGATRLF